MESGPRANQRRISHCPPSFPQLTLNIPKHRTAQGGLDALTHALESYVSVFATGERLKGLIARGRAMTLQPDNPPTIPLSFHRLHQGSLP